MFGLGLGEVVILVGLLVAFVVAAIVIGARGSTENPREPFTLPTSPGPTRPASAGQTPPTKRRLLINPSWTYEKLSRAFGNLGFSLVEPAGRANPTEARWTSGKATIRYLADPEINFQGVEVEGSDADQARYIVNDIVNSEYVATLETKVHDFLSSDAPQVLLLGIRGAAWLGIGENHKYYWRRVGELRSHADPRIAEEAKKAYDSLVAEAGGNLITPGR